MRILVTGSAGFIGFHLCRRLLADRHEVTGFDGMTPYYDVTLKERRHAILQRAGSFAAHIGMLEDKEALERAFAEARPEMVVHLAAQAGVRYSLEHPEAYVSANLVGSFNLLEAARRAAPRHLLIASTSSVYGGNEHMPFAEMPFRETDNTDSPMTLYAATKKAGEAMSHAYAHLWGLPTTCFRFFTVYGPWGRPDMALFKFVAAIENGEPIEIYGEGKMRRDFTYVDDLIEAVTRLLQVPPVAGEPVTAGGVTDSLSPVAPWRVVNIAGGRAMELLDYIETIERQLGKRAIRKLLPMQKGDLPGTHADAGLLRTLTGYVPATSVEDGVKAFVEWYRAENGR
jgi:UDP-glucuronate 4-epimerase